MVFLSIWVLRVVLEACRLRKQEVFRKLSSCRLRLTNNIQVTSVKEIFSFLLVVIPDWAVGYSKQGLFAHATRSLGTWLGRMNNLLGKVSWPSLSIISRSVGTVDLIGAWEFPFQTNQCAGVYAHTNTKVLSPMGRSTTITASRDFLKLLDLGSGAVPGAGSIGGRDSL